MCFIKGLQQSVDNTLKPIGLKIVFNDKQSHGNRRLYRRQELVSEEIIDLAGVALNLVGRHGLPDIVSVPTLDDRLTDEFHQHKKSRAVVGGDKLLSEPSEVRGRPDKQFTNRHPGLRWDDRMRRT